MALRFTKFTPTMAVYAGDCRDVLAQLPDGRIQMCVTSPPYLGLRNYDVDGQLGQEDSVEAYISELVSVFRDVRRVLKDDGTLWLNVGDSYDRSKNLLLVPARLALALRADGWYLRQDIIWHKSNPMPESVKDRCTKSHEFVFLLAKSPRYYFDHEALKEPANCGPRGPSYFHVGKTGEHQLGKAQKVRPSVKRGGFKGKGDAPLPDRQPFRAIVEMRAKRDVWTIPTKPFGGAHFAAYPEALGEPCILAGARPGDIVLDPFFGAGTTGLVAHKLGRKTVGIELNTDYIEMARCRIHEVFPPPADGDFRDRSLLSRTA